jgi:hypothetical protein
VAVLIEKYAPLLRKNDRADEARALEAKAQAIRAKQTPAGPAADL